MNNMKKIISLVLAAAMLLSVCVIGSSAQAPETKAATVKAECGGDCEQCPSVVVPGIGQSNVWLLDDDGNYKLDADGERINCFPAYFDIGPLVAKLLFPVLLTLITQQDLLSDALANAVADCFYMNTSDINGKSPDCIEVEQYPYSLAECSEYEKEYIYDCIPLKSYADAAGEDHLYFYAYNSFGNHADIVDGLYEFIQQVKEETGHDKINLVPISMGGEVANGLLEYYPDVHDDINKLVYIVPALDGSTIVGDLYTKNLVFLDKQFLFNGFLEGLMDEEEARMIEVIARIIPDEVLMSCLNATVDKLVDDVLRTNTNLWALVPSAYYPEASQTLLAGDEYKEIKRQTDRYYQAQLNSDANILKVIEAGGRVYNIVDYDVPLYVIGGYWNNDNADGVIHLDSTSMGAHSAICGETLPEDYVQQNINCSNPDHNHISPDRVIDASTGLLPDTTFYFDGQNHEKTARNDIIISLAIDLLLRDDIVDVYSDPGYPQFNIARDPRGIKSRLADAKAVDQSKLSQEDKAELNAAIAEAEAIIGNTAGVAGEMEASEARLRAILVKIGVYAPPEEEEEPSDFFTKLSLFLYENYGSNGFIEMPELTLNNILTAIAEFVSANFLTPIYKAINK